jgi:hypothetical protein
MALIALFFFVMVFLRSRKIPECFSCGAMKVRPTRVVGFWDTVGYAFQLRPYRCEGCRERFHGFLRSGAPAAVNPVQRQRVVKIVIRFHKGLPNRIAIRIIGKSDPISDAATIVQT